MTDLLCQTEAILILVAFVAGIVDALAGGGGLITVPALLIAGVPPLSAIATNKLQGSFGTGVAAATFMRSGFIDIKKEWPTACLCFLGAIFGAMLASFVPTDLLTLIMPYVLLSIAAFFLIKRNLGDEARRQVFDYKLVGLAVIPLVAIFDGFFGPGAGSLYMISLVVLAGKGILGATARVKVFNFASNLGGLAGFIYLGSIYWKLGLLMAIGQIAGSIVGSKIAIKGGASVIKPLLVSVCMIMAVKLIMS